MLGAGRAVPCRAEPSRAVPCRAVPCRAGRPPAARADRVPLACRRCLLGEEGYCLTSLQSALAFLRSLP